MQKTQQNIIDGLMVILRGHGHIGLDEAIDIKGEFERSDTERFEDYLIEQEIVDREQLLQAMGQFYNVRPFDVMGAIFDPHLVTMFPQDFLILHCCIPYEKENDIMIIIAGDPTNENLDEALNQFVSYDFQYYVGIPGDIDMMINEFSQREVYQLDADDVVDIAERETEMPHVEEEDGVTTVHMEEEGHDDGDNKKV